MYFGKFDPYEFAITMVALIICITIHEFAHAYSAYLAGDETPRKQGRISLNPLDHLDPMGTIMMVVTTISHFGIGWGKPVRINPNNFRHPRRDDMLVSLWGPLSNVLTAAVVGIVLRIWGMGLNLNALQFLVTLTFISITLAVFNLLPIAPLDGSHILAALLPYEQARRYELFMAQYGMLIFLGLILLGGSVLPLILGPPRQALWNLVSGPTGNQLLIKLYLAGR